ncbi:DUF1367 family protein [Frigidibacter sp. MR17.24]|uniref:DUF1367 family protein n=1 Tax=Frigidibacter sp. MR17.24 TaxID=3127345 RepID=UPI003012BE33
MADLSFMRTPAGLAPADSAAAEWFAKVKMGQPVTASVRLPRNGKFHRKFFAMLDVAYSNHEWPEMQTKFGAVRTSPEMFRKYVIVKAGHYEADMTPHGEIRVVPKSIAWSKMDEAEFSQLYSDVLDVILAEFLTNWTTGDMDRAVELMMGFA